MKCGLLFIGVTNLCTSNLRFDRKIRGDIKKRKKNNEKHAERRKMERRKKGIRCSGALEVELF